ncbi:hypothetical protein K8M07_04285 [Schnuerera sp. xch1]|uniref:glycosyl-4,4'-diaponeurosporenoate acyltransferase CrtO family protein n=1 Tax=Schnuerera sp. xch1 TaxID=2874283 RepID=UPI001CBEF7C8|nr:hypothetical protein [Schnuerera sp. xch1]MBZ2174458.1 hypothetical protein [Schnuerera sp. xch1]
MKLLNKIFNDKYYSIKNFEQEGKIYEILGVKWFKRMLLHIARNRKNEVPFNVITNIYPIFLQRYNRIRIKRVLQKMK